jgi:hypothetical protein
VSAVALVMEGAADTAAKVEEGEPPAELEGSVDGDAPSDGDAPPAEPESDEAG